MRAGLTSELIAALEAIGSPVYLSGMGRGLLGRSHRLQMKHNRGVALSKADFVLLAGVPADFRINYGRGIGPKAYFATINLCAVTLNKNNDIRRPNVKIHADATHAIVALSKRLPKDTAANWSEWHAQLAQSQVKRDQEISRLAAQESKQNPNFVSPLSLCQAIESAASDTAVFVADGGDFVGSASYIIQPRGPLSWLDPGVFGTLGVGAGFALGAKVARPGSETWIIFGDGAFGWSISELDTMVRMKLPAIAVIGNDACWSQMYRDQIRLLKDPVATQLAYTRYDTVAEGFGAKGILVRSNEEVPAALAKAKELASQGHTVVVNCLIAKSSFREGSISL